VALGNALRAGFDPAIVDALRNRRDTASALVREHIDWALAQVVEAESTASEGRPQD
jgi:epoxyqueuosine reductase